MARHFPAEATLKNFQLGSTQQTKTKTARQHSIEAFETQQFVGLLHHAQSAASKTVLLAPAFDGQSADHAMAVVVRGCFSAVVARAGVAHFVLKSTTGCGGLLLPP